MQKSASWKKKKKKTSLSSQACQTWLWHLCFPMGINSVHDFAPVWLFSSSNAHIRVCQQTPPHLCSWAEHISSIFTDSLGNPSLKWVPASQQIQLYLQAKIRGYHARSVPKISHISSNALLEPTSETQVINVQCNSWQSPYSFLFQFTVAHVNFAKQNKEFIQI